MARFGWWRFWSAQLCTKLPRWESLTRALARLAAQRALLRKIQAKSAQSNQRPVSAR
jgi:hypothetical protein